MARDNLPAGADQPSTESQKQMASGEAERKAESPEEAAKQSGEAEFFDGTITKVKTLEDGRQVTVMSDHLLPGEELKRTVDARKAEERVEASRERVAAAGQGRVDSSRAEETSRAEQRKQQAAEQAKQSKK